MKAGDTVVCRDSRGYDLTTGKEYTVLRYEPEYYDSECAAGFTWPACVWVNDNRGNKVQAHAHRFRLKEGT